MINLDISTLIFVYILFSVVSILVIWVISVYRKAKAFTLKETDVIWKCSVCFHNYVDSKHNEISICPLCGSYNKRG